MKLTQRLIVILCLFTFSSSGQENQEVQYYRNAAYGELGGNGLLYSINYDRIFKVEDKYLLSGRAGISLIGGFDSTGMTLPLSFSYLIGKKRDFLELGIGPTAFAFPANDIWATAVFGIVGYRHQDIRKRGWLWKISVNPFIGEYTSDKGYWNWVWVPSASIGLGYSF